MKGSCAFVVASLLLAQPSPKFDPERLPYRAAWGPYTVVVEKVGAGDWDGERARVLDAGGQVLREVENQRITGVSFRDLTGEGTPDLWLSTFSGGAHCCSTDYFFTREGGLRNLLIFDGRNGGINAIKDLNGDGRPEILAGSDVLAYFADLPYAASPWMPMVIGWEGERYVDQTRRYPDRPRKQGLEYRGDLQKALGQKGELAEQSRRMGAAGYYANALVAGEGTAARAWILQHAPATTRGWLQRNERELRVLAVSGKTKLSTSQERLLRPAEQ
jgi:hypothetical protein